MTNGKLLTKEELNFRYPEHYENIKGFIRNSFDYGFGFRLDEFSMRINTYPSVGLDAFYWPNLDMNALISTVACNRSFNAAGLNPPKLTQMTFTIGSWLMDNCLSSGKVIDINFSVVTELCHHDLLGNPSYWVGVEIKQMLINELLKWCNTDNNPSRYYGYRNYFNNAISMDFDTSSSTRFLSEKGLDRKSAIDRLYSKEESSEPK